jgi:hypothetical protein
VGARGFWQKSKKSIQMSIDASKGWQRGGFQVPAGFGRKIKNSIK